MEDNLNFKTFLFIDPKKIIISVISDTNRKIYQEELIFDQEIHDTIFGNLDLFLNKNIFKIEKKLNNFVKKIYTILDTDKFFPVEISLKKKNYENLFDLKGLNYLLYEAKDYCKKTIDDRKIIHMVINNYQIDNKIYSFLPIDIDGNSFSVDITFICIANSFIKSLEDILKKYQISLGQVVSANYVTKFLINDEKDIFLMTKKMINGHNPNEVMLVNKTIKNQGFFEKFFNFFR